MSCLQGYKEKVRATTNLGIFVGYFNTPHNYRVYLPSHRMTVVCKDVKFNEENAMRCSLEREFHLHVDEELLAPKEEPMDDVEQPHTEEKRVEEPTHAKTSRDGRKRTKEADRLMHDSRENVGAPTSQRMQRRSLDQYTGYMALMSESVETKPSSFKEAVQSLVWVDAMVEEYDSIIRNNAWEVVPRPEDKSMVGSRWIYKVKQAAYGSVKKHKVRFVPKGFSQVEGNDYEETISEMIMRRPFLR